MNKYCDVLELYDEKPAKNGVIQVMKAISMIMPSPSMNGVSLQSLMMLFARSVHSFLPWRQRSG